MARLNPDSPLNAITGKIGKQLVFKRYGDKTIVSKFPDMNGIKPTVKQKQNRRIFKEAVAYAKRINNNKLLKEQYLAKLSAGQSVYHFAIKEFLNKYAG